MRRLGLAAVVLAFSLTATIPAMGAAGRAGADAGAAPESGRTGNLIALLRSTASGKAALERTGVHRIVSIPAIGAVAVRPAPGQSVAAARRLLLADPAVRRVEAERYRTLRFLPDDPALTEPDRNAPADAVYQWNLRRERFPKAWKRSKGRRARLAVIDTGIDATHPDLAGRIVHSKGYDYADCGGLLQPSCTGPGYDEVGHGTHVAGLACGTGNNGFGLAGGAFACRLIVEKASDRSTLSDSLIAASITDATDHGADVISMSFGGGDQSGAISSALDYAYDHDVVLVAAASNRNTQNQGYPARYLQPTGTAQNLNSGKGLVVTAAGFDGGPAWFHPGHGTGVSLAAYGASSRTTRGIFSTFPANPTDECCRTTFHGSNRFAYLEGTSMATPQVAAAAALMRSERPGIENARVLRILKRSATARGFTSDLGWGILDAGRALRKAVR
jgi:subtilisin family serine protease